jgi:phosphoglucomutase
MVETYVLLDKAKNGFNTLNIGEKYVSSALKWLEQWLTDSQFEEYVPQIQYLIESQKWNFLLDSFYQVIPFGTGGRRGTVGIGPIVSTHGPYKPRPRDIANTFLSRFGDEVRKKGVVLTYDVRRYTEKGIYNPAISNPIMNLDAKDLAKAAAEVYAANGIKIFMFDGVRSTPLLSFAIRYLNAAAGDMFSASHNLPTDNGKKIYDHLGGQLIPPHDQILVDEVTENVHDILRIPMRKLKNRGLCNMFHLRWIMLLLNPFVMFLYHWKKVSGFYSLRCMALP